MLLNSFLHNKQQSCAVTKDKKSFQKCPLFMTSNCLLQYSINTSVYETIEKYAAKTKENYNLHLT